MKLHARTCRCTSAAGCDEVDDRVLVLERRAGTRRRPAASPGSPASSFANTSRQRAPARPPGSFGISVSSVVSGRSGSPSARGCCRCRTSRPCSGRSSRSRSRRCGPPTPTDRAAVVREQRRMPVDDPEPRHVDRVLRDEPRERRAERRRRRRRHEAAGRGSASAAGKTRSIPAATRGRLRQELARLRRRLLVGPDRRISDADDGSWPSARSEPRVALGDDRRSA